MVKLHESSSHRKLRNEIVLSGTICKSLAFTPDAALRCRRAAKETAIQPADTFFNPLKSARNLGQSLPRFPAL
jgi:hypothetical protein